MDFLFRLEESLDMSLYFVILSTEAMCHVGISLGCVQGFRTVQTGNGAQLQNAFVKLTWTEMNILEWVAHCKTFHCVTTWNTALVMNWEPVAQIEREQCICQESKPLLNKMKYFEHL